VADITGQQAVTAMAVAVEEDSNDGIWQRYLCHMPFSSNKTACKACRRLVYILNAILSASERVNPRRFIVSSISLAVTYILCIS